MDYEKGSIDVEGTRLTTLTSKDLALDAPVLVFGHGAGANLQHAHMTAIADALGDQGIATFRYNFPYMELGKQRVVDGDVHPVDARHGDFAVFFCASAGKMRLARSWSANALSDLSHA